MTDTVPAVASGLPSSPAFDRRSFLATLAAAGVMTGAALPAEVAAADHPDAELLELVALFAAADARANDLGWQSDAVYAEQYQAPAYTEAMFWQPSDRFSVWMQPERLDSVNIGGAERLTYDTQGVVADLTSKSAFWRSLGSIDRICGPGDIARVQEIIAAVSAYRAAERKAMETCGCTAIDQAFDAEMAAAAALMARIIGTPARTPEGICAKARAAGISRPYEIATARLCASLIADAEKLGTAAVPASDDRSAA